MSREVMSWPETDIPGAISAAFSLIEGKDEIVRIVYVSPKLLKRIVLSIPDEIEFDYIPEGVGMLRTAYIRFKPTVSRNEIRFQNEAGTEELRLFLV